VPFATFIINILNWTLKDMQQRLNVIDSWCVLIYIQCQCYTNH